MTPEPDHDKIITQETKLGNTTIIISIKKMHTATANGSPLWINGYVWQKIYSRKTDSSWQQ